MYGCLFVCLYVCISYIYIENPVRALRTVDRTARMSAPPRAGLRARSPSLERPASSLAPRSTFSSDLARLGGPTGPATGPLERVSRATWRDLAPRMASRSTFSSDLVRLGGSNGASTGPSNNFFDRPGSIFEAETIVFSMLLRARSCAGPGREKNSSWALSKASWRRPGVVLVPARSVSSQP